MKKLSGLIMVLVLATVILAPLAAASAAPITQVSYVEGSVNLKPGQKPARDLNIGDKLAIGDTIRTGADGLAELDRAGVTLKINPKTVFVLSEKSVDNQKRDVVNVVMGSVKMRYDKLGGQEPLIHTASCAAAVRGTEISIFSGEDGATLIAVDSGLIEVSAEGQTVSLGAGEGVEVPTGQAPGRKFEIKSQQVDYQSWNKERVTAMQADPLRAMADLRRLLDEYIRAVESYNGSFTSLKDQLSAEREKLSGIKRDQGEDAFTKYRDEVVTPLSFEAAASLLNVRFHALAAMSMRRYVAGRLYLQEKPSSLDSRQSQTWLQFNSDYQEFLASYEHSIVPQLVEADY